MSQNTDREFSPPEGLSLSYTQKLSLLAGSISALYLLPSAANAAIVYQNTPISLAYNVPGGTFVDWDVDGVGGADFQLFKQAVVVTYYGGYGGGSIFFASRDASYNPLNGRGLVAPYFTDNVQALQQSFVVGPTLANYVWGSGSVSGYRSRNAMQKSGPNYVIGYDFNFGFNPGDNFFGFRFNSGGNLLYGWGTINFDLTNGIVSIKEWAYNDTPDGSIHIPDGRQAETVPEPTSSLALLAFGAAGVYGWRKKRKSPQIEEDRAA